MWYTIADVEEARRDKIKIDVILLRFRNPTKNISDFLYLNKLDDDSYCVSRNEKPIKLFENFRDAEKFFNNYKGVKNEYK